MKKYETVFNTEMLFVQNEMFEPIFYKMKYLIPPKIESCNTKELEQKIWDNYDYIQGLKQVSTEYTNNISDISEKEKQEKKNNRFIKIGGLNRYKNDLLDILKNFDEDEQIVLTTIPSSKVSKINVVNRIVEAICEENKCFLNGNRLFIKTRDEQSASISGGISHRSYKKHYDSWDRNIEISKIFTGKKVIVIDDVLTTGASFFAARKHLNDLGFEDIYFFAFGKTERSILYENCFCRLAKQIDESIVKAKQIDGVIIDIDQTIIETSGYDFDMDNRQALSELNEKYKGGFYLYNNIDQLFKLLRDKKIPFIFVTNRKTYFAKAILTKYFEELFGHRLKYNDLEGDFELPVCTQSEMFEICSFKLDKGIYNNIDEANVLISYDDARKIGEEQGLGKYYDQKNATYRTIPAIKPHSAMVQLAKEKLEEIGCNRIIGVGNSETDILAFKAVGIESILVNWGNKAKIFISNKPNKIFSDVEELCSLINNEGKD